MPGSGGHLAARGGHMVAGSPVPGHFVNSIGAMQTSQGKITKFTLLFFVLNKYKT